MFSHHHILGARPLPTRFQLDQAGKLIEAALLIVCGLTLAGQPALAAIAIQIGDPAYVQDFNTLADSGKTSTVPAGWSLLETGNPGHSDGNYAASDGSSSKGETYSFGSAGSTDRAFGTLQDKLLLSRIGVAFENTSVPPVTSLIISYSGEQWRLGGDNVQDRLTFQYSLDATDLSDTWTWTDYTAGDFNAPVTSGTAGPLDGNANSVSVAFTLNGLNLAQNSTIWLRWFDTEGTGGEHGLAIDNFSLTAVPEPSAWGVLAGVFLGFVAVLRRVLTSRGRKLPA